MIAVLPFMVALLTREPGRFAAGGGEKESQSAVLQQRLLANLASYAEVPYAPYRATAQSGTGAYAFVPGRY